MTITINPGFLYVLIFLLGMVMGVVSLFVLALWKTKR